jgi:hypothetical protein
VDEYCCSYFSDHKNVDTIKLLDFDGCHFGDNDSIDKFKIIMKTKMESMKKGIEKYGYSLFLDSDLIFLSGLDDSFFRFLGDSSKTLFVTSHCHDDSEESKQNEMTYGTYNVGMLCSKDINFPDKWRHETEKLNCSLGLEQKPVTVIAEHDMNVVEISPPIYNVGWWRMVVSNHIENLTVDETNKLCLFGDEVINLHAHSDPKLGRPIEKQFLNHIFNIIQNSDEYEKILGIMENVFCREH